MTTLCCCDLSPARLNRDFEERVSEIVDTWRSDHNAEAAGLTFAQAIKASGDDIPYALLYSVWTEPAGSRTASEAIEHILRCTAISIATKFTQKLTG